MIRCMCEKLQMEFIDPYPLNKDNALGELASLLSANLIPSRLHVTISLICLLPKMVYLTSAISFCGGILYPGKGPSHLLMEVEQNRRP